MKKKDKLIHPHILLMKVGPYCGYSLKEIIKIKQKEELKCGKFFWGYSGVFCRPNTIKSFLSYAEMNGDCPLVLFSTTLSEYKTEEKDRFSHFSLNNSVWEPLPKEVLLVGRQKKPHFAIIAKNLKKVNLTINLSDYCSFIGMFPNPHRYLDRYFKYRVDKACGVYRPREKSKRKTIKISYSCELTKPYCAHIK